jgi:hypothetical protein
LSRMCIWWMRWRRMAENIVNLFCLWFL